MKNLVSIFALTLIAGLTVGCASTTEIKAIRAEATEAKTIASNAMDKASEAKAIATEARSVSLATEEKINRMFKRSMFK